MTMAAPLAGIRILELTHMLAGPYCSLLLADLGADVVKVESAERPDLARTMPGCTVAGETAYFHSLNRNKRSVVLDLKDKGGYEAFLRLVARADVVLDNFRPGVTARLRVDFARLREVNPLIVTCSISGFGSTGPRRDLPAYDYLIQAMAGTMSLTGDPDAPPTKFGISIVDHTAGLLAAFAILAALRGVQKTGEGRHVDIALFDAHLSMLTYLAADYLNCGIEPRRYASSAHPYIVPSQLFAAREGYLIVMPMTDHMWRTLCETLGLTELAEDPALAGAPGRLEQRDRVTATIASRLAELSTAEVAALLVDAGVPAAPVNSVAEALADPQVGAREMVVEAGGVRMVGNPVKLSDMAEQPLRPAPRLGEHSREILREAGLPDEEIDRLCPRS